MKFLADINIAQSVIDFLRQNGHDVLDAKSKYLTAKDIELIEKAKEHNRIILTRDKDFLGLVQFPKYAVPLIFIRLINQNPQHIITNLSNLLSFQNKIILEQSLTIVSEDAANSYPFEILET